jgi:hypothetical protein
MSIITCPFDAPAAGLRAHLTPAAAPAPQPAHLTLDRGGRQWLPVTAHIRERYLVTYRAPAENVARVVPAPLTVDQHGGCGFVSVCSLEIDDMGVAGTPSWLRFGNREMLYRVGVRVSGQPSFFTLRSDVSSRALARLGAWFSHYRPRLGQLGCDHDGGRFHLTCRSRDGAADAELEVPAPAGDEAAPRASLFADAAEAARFLLGMRISADVRPGGRVRVQEIDHDPWRARFTTPVRRRFDFVDALARAIGAPLVYDHTLAMRDLRQTWRAARWT